MPTIEELRAQLRAAEQAELERGRAEYAAVREAATFEWQLEKRDFGFRVQCRYDQRSREAVAAWRERFPQASVINFRKPDEWHGMTYILGYTREGQPFLIGGGGAVILRLSEHWSSEPAPITKEQAEQFEAGIIPAELKKPW